MDVLEVAGVVGGVVVTGAVEDVCGSEGRLQANFCHTHRHPVCFNWDRLIGTISKFWGHVVLYVRMSVCLSVCMWENWDIDIKNLTVSQLNHTGCNTLDVNNLSFIFLFFSSLP